ncbi:glycerol-3-phosphate dehydrogenase/oxidase [Limimaricola cinnabarinus]|uniref:Glycerol-3-phosphate dehydrogenase n=1 Tax=Limimaricola cinnabarinus LL-001 TaxID=1337093 RepID=U2Z6P0_9RHOB|nr:glycerol-3-phosphate dehydrogenase/oxidase [Limimaricola cinnabarinus]GAD56722.1 glycerol-3-phosphate dehydrogenase [Limimaricola cinnabarinus LL-001]
MSDTRRGALLQRLRDTRHVPVLIVGGGINGMGTFRDLALQGVDCLLVERGDFCSGTSRAPSRMIHGGLKYLETGEFRLVRESAEERNRLLQNAAHYVHPLEMIIPIYSWTAGILPALRRFLRRPAKLTERGAAVIKFGLTLYDLYGRSNRVLPRHRMIRRADALREIPDLDPQIRIAASYYDAWITSPERLVIELALDGMEANPASMALNHVSFDGMESDRARLRDATTGEVFLVGCDLMINAAGPWIDRVNAAAGEAGRMIGGTKGSHLLLDLPIFARSLEGRMMYFEAEGGRICLVSNFMGHVLLGSTDLATEDPDGAVCTDEEVDYLLDAFRRIFPGVTATRDNIFFSYTGVRPLPAQNASDPGAISRDHSIPVLPPTEERNFPILSLVGGKWTTFRSFSAEVTDVALSCLSRERRRTTKDVAIGGGVGLSQRASDAEALLSDLTATGLSRTRAARLLTCYGSRARLVANSFRGPETFLTQLPDVSHEELVFIVRHEVVHSAQDVLFGRGALFLERPLPRAALSELVLALAGILDWDAARITLEEENLVERYRRHHRIRFDAEGMPQFV